MNDKREGKGTYTFACGDTYEGEWLDGMYHGYGKYSSKDSDEYEGQWVKDRMSGHGKFFYRELGDVYEGDWENGFREGFGKYMSDNVLVRDTVMTELIATPLQEEHSVSKNGDGEP